MRIGTYGVLIILALFILLMIFNPKLSCFGKRLRSPLYPLLRKRKKKAVPETQDYGFRLVEGTGRERRTKTGEPHKPGKKTEDYGFRLD
ncbi:MAG: hypothetical protein QHH14_09850 [Clostridiales bacterium]|nr:hypothetical protein [Clostridiales bacterium]